MREPNAHELAPGELAIDAYLLTPRLGPIVQGLAAIGEYPGVTDWFSEVTEPEFLDEPIRLRSAACAVTAAIEETKARNAYPCAVVSITAIRSVADFDAVELPCPCEAHVGRRRSLRESVERAGVAGWLVVLSAFEAEQVRKLRPRSAPGTGGYL